MLSGTHRTVIVMLVYLYSAWADHEMGLTTSSTGNIKGHMRQLASISTPRICMYVCMYVCKYVSFVDIEH